MYGKMCSGYLERVILLKKWITVPAVVTMLGERFVRDRMLARVDECFTHACVPGNCPEAEAPARLQKAAGFLAREQ